ncbi:MAG: bifunctional 2-polyprenyl-6-hydroxyphenol methylase/3-demethylubiquinol 3-O-methyltransferase UbiG [Desulfobacterales bacterium]
MADRVPQPSRGSVREPNLDQVEISKFDTRVADWWDNRGGFRGLHDINPIRLEYINNRSNLAGKRVLDIGCGGGILSEAMAAAGAVVTGIDAAKAPLAVAIKHLQLSGMHVDYRQATAEQMAADRPESFDVVTCMELLEHVPQPASVVQACQGLAKSDGDVFFATLNRNLKSFVLAVVCAEYILGIVHKGTHQYRRFIKPSELERWARESGLSLQDVTGLHYNPIFRKCWLGGNAHVNYVMHFKKR